MPKLKKENLFKTPIKKKVADAQKVKECSYNELPIQFIVSNYHPTTKYSLSHINSIVITEGKIYNLLDSTIPKRVVKCGCLKSNCGVGYCQCFRSGELCNDECGCKSCTNRHIRQKAIKKIESSGCNCVKSMCLKKYCQCFINKRICGSKCKCLDCHNSIEP